jgi:hypothetical protein
MVGTYDWLSIAEEEVSIEPLIRDEQIKQAPIALITFDAV